MLMKRVVFRRSSDGIESRFSQGRNEGSPWVPELNPSSRKLLGQRRGPRLLHAYNIDYNLFMGLQIKLCSKPLHGLQKPSANTCLTLRPGWSALLGPPWQSPYRKERNMVTMPAACLLSNTKMVFNTYLPFIHSLSIYL